jgi:ribosomal protein L17
MWRNNQMDQNRLYSMDAVAHVEELKQDYDYRTTFVTRLQQEITREQAELAEVAADDEDNDVKTAVANARIAWFGERLAEQQTYQTEAKKWYDQAAKERNQQIEREEKEIELQQEQSLLSQDWNKIHNQRFLLDLYSQLLYREDIEKTEKETEELNRQIAKMTKDIGTAETQANNAQTLLDQKRNAFYRKIENQDFERHLESQKEDLINM